MRLRTFHASLFDLTVYRTWCVNISKSYLQCLAIL